MAEDQQTVMPLPDISIPEAEQARAEFKERFPDVGIASDLGVRIRREIAYRVHRDNQLSDLAGRAPSKKTAKDLDTVIGRAIVQQVRAGNRKTAYGGKTR